MSNVVPGGMVGNVGVLDQGNLRTFADLGELTPTRRPRPPPPAVAAVPGSNVDKDEDNDGDRGQCQQDQSPHGPQGGPCAVSVRTGLLALVILHSSTLTRATKMSVPPPVGVGGGTAPGMSKGSGRLVHAAPIGLGTAHTARRTNGGRQAVQDLVVEGSADGITTKVTLRPRPSQPRHTGPPPRNKPSGRQSPANGQLIAAWCTCEYSQKSWPTRPEHGRITSPLGAPRRAAGKARSRPTLSSGAASSLPSQIGGLGGRDRDYPARVRQTTRLNRPEICVWKMRGNCHNSLVDLTRARTFKACRQFWIPSAFLRNRSESIPSMQSVGIDCTR